MCFSANAIFIEGSALTVVEVASLREARHRRETALGGALCSSVFSNWSKASFVCRLTSMLPG